MSRTACGAAPARLRHCWWGVRGLLFIEDVIHRFGGEALLHLAFVTVAGAFLVRDVLWLRCLSIVAYGLFMAVAAIAQPAIPWPLFAWYVGFIAINLAHAVWLLGERRLSRLDPEEQRLRELSFSALDAVLLKRLLRRGVWCELAAGERLTRHGEPPAELYALLEGRVSVQVDGSEVATIGPGHFVGEMAFVTGAAASADTVAVERVRAFRWAQSELSRLCARDPIYREAIYSALGPDLARKIAQTSQRTRTQFDEGLVGRSDSGAALTLGLSES